MTALWQKFLDFEEECADEPGGAHSELELTAADFPAWLLLHEPGLAQQLAADLPREDSSGEAHYRTVHHWLHARRAGQRDEEIEWRKVLKQSHAGLFRYLTKTV
jgi:hypothetical protein